MVKIEYKEFQFGEPEITEEQYKSLKMELTIRPYYRIDAKPETFNSHFSGILSIIWISLVLFILGLLFGGSTSIWNPIMGLSFLAVLTCGIILLKEVPKFKRFTNKKEDYFSKLKYDIINTDCYSEYIEVRKNSRLIHF